MLIIKEKCPIFVGINKDQSPKILDSIPSKGACFEFESFSNQDVLEFSLIQQKLHENPNDLEAQKSIIRFAENSIKNIHNTTLKKTQFPILFLYQIILSVYIASHIEEDDAIFLD